MNRRPLPCPAPVALAALAFALAVPATACAQHDMRAATPQPAPADEAHAPMAAHAMHDDAVFGSLVFDQLEAGESVQSWNARGWLGSDLHRAWLRTEGDREDGRLEDASVELLYGHPVSPWWDLLAGLRHDGGEGGSRDFLAIGLQGEAPFKVDVAATAYLGESGRSAARIELEYEAWLGARLALQPSIEANLYGRADPRRGLGAGLSTLETGLRLRYEFDRRFAPYVGIVHEHAYGDTADLRRANGHPAAETRFVVGIRTWF